MQNGIFNVDGLQHDIGQITAGLSINKNSLIFEGHFPWQPVVPGACMVQLIKDVLEDVFHSPVHLKKSRKHQIYQHDNAG